MGTTEKKLCEAIETPFKQAIRRVQQEGVSLSDMYVCVRFDDLSMAIYDDMDNILEQTTIDEWDELRSEQTDFEEEVIKALRSVLNNDRMKKAFESLDLVGPFSVILINEEHEHLEDLVTFDKDTVFLDNDLLSNWDKDLDDFFEKLMSDVK